MPIYAYRCTSCGHTADVLQKMSDAVLTHCPACHAETYVKQVTAAGFQLKGSGWYVTDFKGDNKPAKPAADSDGQAPKTDSTAAANPSSSETTVKPAPQESSATPAAVSAPAPAPAATPSNSTP